MRLSNKIDLRSDTVTIPSASMKKAVLDARLGDDVMHEDATTNDLESKAATILGKEAALFVPSGTMGNLVSILTHCNRGDEIIVGDKSHTFFYEAGGVSAYGGIHSRQLKNNEDGTIDLQLIKESIRSEDDHFPQTTLISLENTHNRCWGSPLPLGYLNDVYTLAKEQGIHVHIDGARIFNASIAINANVSEIASYADSIMFCLSKGLSSPIGSIICGTEDFIYRARKIRKGLGGGMRQSGIIACLGIYSLDNMVDHLKEDHRNAQFLAEELSKSDLVEIDSSKAQTNLVYFKVSNPKINSDTFVEECQNKGLLFYYSGGGQYRLVTHLGIDKEDVQSAVDIIVNVLNLLEEKN